MLWKKRMGKCKNLSSLLKYHTKNEVAQELFLPSGMKYLSPKWSWDCKSVYWQTSLGISGWASMCVSLGTNSSSTVVPLLLVPGECLYMRAEAYGKLLQVREGRLGPAPGLPPAALSGILLELQWRWSSSRELDRQLGSSVRKHMLLLHVPPHFLLEQVLLTPGSPGVKTCPRFPSTAN